MNELVKWMREYDAIVDRDSLYARVLMSMIRDRESMVRDELVRQLDATIRNREHRAQLRHFARTESLERLVSMYVSNCPIE